MDSRGRLFVGDRSNNRIVIFDQDGRQLAVWRQFSRPSGIYIDKRDVIYVADSESESVSRNHDGWKRGIRVGSARDGSVTAFIPDPVDKATTTSAAEGVAADADGNIYGAEVGPKGVKKYVRASGAPAAENLPRTPDGRPDLQGIWRPASRIASDVGELPYQPAALAKKQEHFRQRATLDPLAQCFLAGVPRIMYLDYPFQIFQTHDDVAITFEWQHVYRLIYTNGTNPTTPLPFWMGDSRGRWEGDTLVVDVTNHNDRTWFDMAGNFHSDALHVTERYTMPDADTIRYEATIEDPQVFTRPWTITVPLKRQKGMARVLEYPCRANMEEARGEFKPELRTWYRKDAAPVTPFPPQPRVPAVAAVVQGTVPRMPDGKPDLSGFADADAGGANWGFEPHNEPFTPGGRGVLTDPKTGGLPYQDWARAERQDRYTNPARGYDDPTAHCFPGGVPLQRPQQFGSRNVLTEDEFQARIKQARQTEEDALADFDVTTADTRNAGAVGSATSPPPHWLERGKPSRQVSLIVDPPDGRQPTQVPDAQQRAADAQAARKGRGPADSYTDRSLYDRCVTRGVLGSILPVIYNNGNEIVQAPGVVVIRNEMIHETRIVPLDGRPHLTPSIKGYMGDSRGWWDGNTLVVETTNLNGRNGVGPNGGGSTSDRIKLTERFMLVDANTLQYEVIIDDPGTWSRPWTIAFPWKRDQSYGMFEYACHEGNYAMKNILTGARADDAAK